jgi:glycosyltransferase involved in cell wall biosynthesis
MKKLLLLLKLPPPTTGVTKMCQAVLDNEGLFKQFDTKVIGLSYAKNVKNTGQYNFGKLMMLLKSLFATLNSLISFRPDVVYFVPSLTGTAFLRDFLFIILLKLFRKKIVYHLHGTGIMQSAQKSKLFNAFYKFASNGSEVIILSEKLKYDIAFLNTSAIHILPNGINNNLKIQPATHPDWSGQRATGNRLVGTTHSRTLFVSNFYNYKGVPELITLLCEVHKQGQHFTCKIVGEENHISAKELNEMISVNGLDKKVEYIGSVVGEELEKLYDESDIFIYPTKKDAMPLVILEAMRAGLAILANPVGAIPDMIGQDLTLLPTPENLIGLLENPEKTRKLGIQNRNTFEEKFTIDKFHIELVSIIDQIF